MARRPNKKPVQKCKHGIATVRDIGGLKYAVCEKCRVPQSTPSTSIRKVMDTLDDRAIKEQFPKAKSLPKADSI